MADFSGSESPWSPTRLPARRHRVKSGYRSTCGPRPGVAMRVNIIGIFCLLRWNALLADGARGWCGEVEYHVHAICDIG
jgi:hypothetical protein